MSTQTEALRHFEELIGLPEVEREKALERICAQRPGLRDELLALLAADTEAESVHFLAYCAIDLDADRSGQQVGPWRLERLIGHGGMGSVYQACRADGQHRRPVALKMLRFDFPDLRRRLMQEQKIIAALNHPNIAGLLDAGRDENGAPYVAMDYIDGQSIRDYCLGRELDSRRIITLFLKVLDAVQYAHSHLVVHRDLKPGNILIDEHGHPRLLDFGIAKLLDESTDEQLTRTGQSPLTPDYASPEQLLGEAVSTASDIYALGVLLYELLAGQHPFPQNDHSHGAYQRASIDSLPPRPSRAARRTRRRLPRELDHVVFKAMAREPEQRYRTCAEFGDDLRRFIEGHPVLAVHAGWRYRTVKFVSRHRYFFAAGSLVAMALAGTTIWAVIQADKAGRQARAAQIAEAAAQRSAQELEQVVKFQERQLAELDPHSLGQQIRQQIVDRRRTVLEQSEPGPVETDAAMARLEEQLEGVNFSDLALQSLDETIFGRALGVIGQEFGDQPLVRARLLQAVADTLRELGRYDSADDPQARALAIRNELLGETHPDTLLSQSNHGLLLLRRGELEQARPSLEAAAERSLAVLGIQHEVTASTHNNLGLWQQAQGMLDEAAASYETALGSARLAWPEGHAEALTIANNKGLLLWEQGHYREARGRFEALLPELRKRMGERHPKTLLTQANLGLVLHDLGELEEAMSQTEAALDGRRDILGAEHPDTLVSMNNVALIFMRMGDLGAAEEWFRQAIERSSGAFGDQHSTSMTFLSNLTALLRTQGRLEEAGYYAKQLLEQSETVLGAEHPETLHHRQSLGMLHLQRGDLGLAEPMLNSVYEIRSQLFGEDHPDTHFAMFGLAVLATRRDDLDTAYGHYHTIVEASRQNRGSMHPETLVLKHNLGNVLMRLGRLEEAEAHLRTAADGLPEVLGSEHANARMARISLAALLNEQGQFEQALEKVGASLPHESDVPEQAEERILGWKLTVAGRALTGLGREPEQFREAERVLIRGCELLENHRVTAHWQLRACHKGLETLNETWGKSESGVDT
ncbi:tetratricopeptide repeat protein [Wenzhouxiangella sp. AB-CW3]|uniref:serine/threonine-protein kinase n=1 Tax=Wenzhouxiangella sp. AB-CW3 TaxID=2771012 RepID=UPI00168B5261|nr:serine/threonine-protein kinase [Wenzhouxiangella sp. AB-CW3]QOC23936.1 tetratricopeptide repeat protein [Wenzhouxiangella sp. AB-CW3]